MNRSSIAKLAAVLGVTFGTAWTVASVAPYVAFAVGAIALFGFLLLA